MTAGQAEAPSPDRPAPSIELRSAAALSPSVGAGSPGISFVPGAGPGAVGGGAGAAGPTSAAVTTIRWLAEYFGWQAVSVRRLSPTSSNTSICDGDTMCCSVIS